MNQPTILGIVMDTSAEAQRAFVAGVFRGRYYHHRNSWMWWLGPHRRWLLRYRGHRRPQQPQEQETP
jgi:hypothetical protein